MATPNAMGTERKILKSWKEIASYLGVGVRTAQRWAEHRGLPVRQPGPSGAAVLGFSADIDRWLRACEGQMRRPGEPLDAVVATELLTIRPLRPRQLERELEALLGIAPLMARSDDGPVLRRIATFAMTQCRAESAGFSVLGADDDGQEIFRWIATAGRMKQFEGGTTPAAFSPCGVCLERNAPQLFNYPERFYAYLHPIAPIAELLLIPMHDGNAWVGTIWIISHTGRRKFDSEDARLMHDLGELAAATLSAARLRARAAPTRSATRTPRKRTRA